MHLVMRSLEERIVLDGDAVPEEVVFVEGSIEGYQCLVEAAGKGAEVVVLDPVGDGLEQMAGYLEERRDVDAIHVVTHGAPGHFSVGEAFLSLETVGQHAGTLGRIGEALSPSGDLLFYACQVGASASGGALIDVLAMLTGADVAASTDDTGSAALGGDWDLEMATGPIEASNPLASAAGIFDGLLPFQGWTGDVDDPFVGLDITDRIDPELVDLDSDGDLDMALSFWTPGHEIRYFENTGTATKPVYTLRSGAANPFDGISPGGICFLTLGDIDGDGDVDGLLGEEDGNINFLENTGTPSNPGFILNVADNPLAGVDVGARSAPDLADMDGDGDLDLFVGRSFAAYVYFKNTGSVTNPVLTLQAGADNPLDGVNHNSSHQFIDTADIDADGDIDAILYGGERRYFENTGTATAPVLVHRTGTLDPFDKISPDGSTGFEAADVDGDGLIDVMIESGDILYYQKGVTQHTGPLVPTTPAENPLDGLDVGTESYPGFADIDGDGDLDGFVGGGSGRVHFLENTGTATAPVFAPPVANPFGLFDIGSHASPALVDIDGDGDFDIFIGEGQEYGPGTVNYFENTGTSASPAFTQRTGAANPLDAVRHTGGVTDDYAYPTFVDLDGDGDFDAFVGGDGDLITLWENTGDAANPVFEERTGAANPMNDFGESDARISFSDVDGDGDMDSFTAGQRSQRFFENTGTRETPVFVERLGSINPLMDRARRQPSTFADLDGDGDEDMILGHWYGTFEVYRSIRMDQSSGGTGSNSPGNPPPDVLPPTDDLLGTRNGPGTSGASGWPAFTWTQGPGSGFGFSGIDGWLDDMSEGLYESPFTPWWKRRRFAWFLE